MKTKYKMMVKAYFTYLDKEVDTVNSFSTKDDYREQAEKFYKDEADEKPPHLDAAEKEIGFQD